MEYSPDGIDDAYIDRVQYIIIEARQGLWLKLPEKKRCC